MPSRNMIEHKVLQQVTTAAMLVPIHQGRSPKNALHIMQCQTDRMFESRCKLTCMLKLGQGGRDCACEGLLAFLICNAESLQYLQCPNPLSHVSAM